MSWKGLVLSGMAARRSQPLGAEQPPGASPSSRNLMSASQEAPGGVDTAGAITGEWDRWPGAFLDWLGRGWWVVTSPTAAMGILGCW